MVTSVSTHRQDPPPPRLPLIHHFMSTTGRSGGCRWRICKAWRHRHRREEKDCLRRVCALP
uniref:Uncharacterized protein n=1 Tax=Triticum urartu TaxID=4572 RepID=A0A8R7P1S5_TRIUA